MKKVIDDAVLQQAEAMIVELMAPVGQGHGPEHAFRVRKMALDFAESGCDKPLVSLIALLHDADDYKFFQGESNAMRIMKAAGVPDDIVVKIKQELDNFGYAKRLTGKAPSMPEAKAVSDADMCDIMGATGIIRLMEYNAQYGHPFFDPDDKPLNPLTAETYTAVLHESPCRHMFDKVLRLPGFMLTEKGYAEACLRLQTTASFLDALFREEESTEWAGYLAKAVASGIKRQST